ncbi:MAG: hypothetical protein IJ127_17440 [Afipia sp.]|jgi:phenylpyruvate tautomerase PptA (4-oxalocrotonate tautomerase family)|nr:hypothetical protein [Afipia sp.]WIG52896.1 MAG: hypothetical protein OJF48_003816 [Afipia sp.]
MPLISVKAPAGVLNDQSKAALSRNLVDVAVECEQIPDEPSKRALCVVMIEEGGAGNWTFGGNDLSGIVALVIATVTVAKGVLDEQSRARFAELGHKAVAEALPGETRRISSSFLFNEIEDGMWGVNGRLWSLREHATASGYRHLQHLVVAS